MTRLFLGALAFAFFSGSPFLVEAAELYTLGPGEHIQVKVSDFRSGGEVYQWPPYETGNDLIVGPNGRVSLPILGELDAAGKTTAELKEEIATTLQAKAGLIARPDVSVQIVRFRPFYVVGEVEKPGEYEYRPGLTVLQAFAIAGGLPRAAPDQLPGFEKDALVSRGDLRVLSVDRISLLARQARVEAEIANSAELVFPIELQTKAADPEVAALLREEKLLFDSNRNGLAKQLEELERNKTYLRDEINQLQQKNVTLDVEVAAMRKERDLVASLLSRGLSAAPRQLELEQSVAQIESNQLDVRVAIARATEDISKSDREILGIKERVQKDLLKEAADVRMKLLEIADKIQTSQNLVHEAEVRAPNMIMSNGASIASLNYFLTRSGVDGKVENLSVGENDRVQPGDVLRVSPTGSAVGGGVATSQ